MTDLVQQSTEGHLSYTGGRESSTLQSGHAATAPAGQGVRISCQLASTSKYINPSQENALKMTTRTTTTMTGCLAHLLIHWAKLETEYRMTDRVIPSIILPPGLVVRWEMSQDNCQKLSKALKGVLDRHYPSSLVGIATIWRLAELDMVGL